HLEHGTETVRRRLIGPQETEAFRVELDDVAKEGAQHAGRLASNGAGGLHRDRVITKVRQLEIAQEHAAVRVRVGTHATVARRQQRAKLLSWGSVLVEQLHRAVGEEPLFELDQVLGLGGEIGEGNLMRSERALDR